MRAGELDRVTATALENALSGFALPLADEWTHGRLADEVRRAMAIPARRFQSERPSNAEIREKLQRISVMALALGAELKTLQDGVDGQLAEFSMHSAGMNNFLVFILDNKTEYARFHRWAAEIQPMAQLLKGAAENTGSQATRWRQKVAQDRRVVAGALIIPIFECAFGQTITVNNWNAGDARHLQPTPFMDFFQRMMVLVFDERATPNLSALLKRARTLHSER